MALERPWPILTAKVKFGYLGFSIGKKWKLLIFQNICRLWPETNWKNEHMWVLKVKVISWPWSKVIYIQNLKLAFFRNHWANQKPNFTCKLSGTRKWKIDDMMLVTWPRWQPCPYMVKTLQKSSSPELAGGFPRNLVCSIGNSSPS